MNWSKVVGYEGLYEVSDCGFVRAIDRTVVNKHGFNRSIKGRALSQRARNGYLACNLCKNGVEKTHNVHRLVAIAFIPNPDKKPQVNHIDGNKENNDISNLEWCTASENQKHASETGLKRALRGSECPSFKGYVIATNIKTGKEIKMAGDIEFEKNGFFSTHVSRCINGQCKSYKGHTFRRV